MQKIRWIVPRVCFALMLCVLVAGFTPVKTSQAQNNSPATPNQYPMPPNGRLVIPFKHCETLEYPAPAGTAGVKTGLQPGARAVTASAALWEYIENGSFENGGESWSASPNDGESVVIVEGGYDGSYSASLSTYIANASLWQTVNIPSQIASASLTFVAAATMATDESFYVALSDADTKDLLGSQELTFESSDAWYTFSFDIDPSLIAGRNVDLTFEMYQNNPDNYSYGFVDAVSLTVETADNIALYLPLIVTR